MIPILRKRYPRILINYCLILTQAKTGKVTLRKSPHLITSFQTEASKVHQIRELIQNKVWGNRVLVVYNLKSQFWLLSRTCLCRLNLRNRSPSWWIMLQLWIKLIIQPLFNLMNPCKMIIQTNFLLTIKSKCRSSIKSIQTTTRITMQIKMFIRPMRNVIRIITNKLCSKINLGILDLVHLLRSLDQT